MGKTCTIVFVYNAKNGLLNSVMDSLHKIVSPSTYSCHLCSISHGSFGMHKEWAEFLEQLPYNIRFLYKDDMIGQLPEFRNEKLPAIFLISKGETNVIVNQERLLELDLDGLKKELSDIMSI
ncbi:MAG: GTPase [Flavobacteriales bacterium]